MYQHYLEYELIFKLKKHVSKIVFIPKPIYLYITLQYHYIPSPNLLRKMKFTLTKKCSLYIYIHTYMNANSSTYIDILYSHVEEK